MPLVELSQVSLIASWQCHGLSLATYGAVTVFVDTVMEMSPIFLYSWRSWSRDLGQTLNPSQKELIQEIEMIQRRAARYVSNRCRNTSSVSSMLDALQWEPLESRRTKIQLTLLFKIINDLVDIRADDYLTSSTGRTRQSHSKKYRQISTRTDSYKFSFFPRTIPVWNSLPASVAEAPSLVSFKKGLSPLSF